MLSRSSQVFSLTLASAFFLFASLTSAQVRTTGTISGTVTDPSGAVVPGASLTISEASTGFSKTVTSNASGEYVFPVLQPGTYSLKVSAKGFADAEYNDVVVSAARTANITVQMKVGSASQTVEISAHSQVLETTTNTLATTISPGAIQNLPLAGRDVLEFAQLVAGAQSAGGQRYTTYDNLPNAAINISVDGTNDNFQRYRTASTGFFTAASLRVGAFDEVTVSTSNLTADAGAEGSSTLRFVTKRGTNQFHGNAFWWAQNSFFNANSYTANARGLKLAKTRLNDYGGSLGGPLWKNKLFFFANVEYQSSPGASLNSPFVLTTGAEQGLYTYNVSSIPSSPPSWVTCNAGSSTCTANLYALAQANSFPNTEDATMAGVLSQIDGFEKNGSLLPGPSASPFLQVLSWNQPTNNTQWWPTTRLDFKITPKVAWHDSWDIYWRKIANVPNYPGSKFAGNGFKSTYYTWSNSVDWTITPTLLNQASFGIESNVEEFNPGAVSNPFATQGNKVIGTAFSQNSIGFGIRTPIPGFILPIPRNNPLWNPADIVTWTRGSHTFNFGGDIRIANMHELETNDPPTYFTGIEPFDPAAGMFTTSNFPGISTSGNNRALNNAASLYAMLTGRLQGVSGFNWINLATKQYAVQGQALAKEKQTVGGIYFQDSWRATHDLALNYGFRWQFSGAIHNTDNFYFSPTYADFLGPSTHLFAPGQLNGVQNPAVTLRPSPYSADLVQPAPNFGFAWNPNFNRGLLGKLAGGGNMVVRGGASISRYDEGWITFENATLFTNPGTGQSVFYFPAASAGPAGSGQFQVGTAFLSDPNVPSQVAGFPASFSTSFPESLFTFASQPFATVDPNIRSPYVESWNFGIQRRLPGNTALEVDYVGNHAVHMWQTFDVNEVNIFENGFLKEFTNAQGNLAANMAQGQGQTFADNTGATGLVPLPIFDTAFTGQPASAGFANQGFVTFLQQGQAGAFAGALAGGLNYFCNLVGGNSSFTPCAGSGGTGTYPINFFQVNPYATGQPLFLLSNPADSTYNALQIQLKHPAGHGLFVGANYTYSHSLSTRYLGGDDSATVNFLTLRNPGLNKGPSAYDLRHVFRAYYTYELPFGKGRTFATGNSILNNIIGGWTTGGIVTWQSGRVFDLLGGQSSFNTQDSGVVLNGISLSQLQSNIGVFPGPTKSEPVVFFNPQLFASNPNPILPEQTPGVIGNNIFLHGPMFVNADLSIMKFVPLYEKVGLSVKATFLNAFNHPNWNVGGGTPGDFVNISSPPFNVASLANGARVIQFTTQLQF